MLDRGNADNVDEICVLVLRYLAHDWRDSLMLARDCGVAMREVSEYESVGDYTIWYEESPQVGQNGAMRTPARQMSGGVVERVKRVNETVPTRPVGGGARFLSRMWARHSFRVCQKGLEVPGSSVCNKEIVGHLLTTTSGITSGTTSAVGQYFSTRGMIDPPWFQARHLMKQKSSATSRRRSLDPPPALLALFPCSRASERDKI
ncbi:hypothetical protein EVAR_96698_1 [Eumeta japonica]|uniref:Uncharacterized protein n=1 Tax=Eumeta variegata TaxID=151549 RepID=A0A4C1WIY4_EUMVA|nr:hypothetical protein EVAR_96698_1 [Eumeta japonica]